MNPLIYGKNPLERIVSIEPKESSAEIFCEMEDGSIQTHTVPNSHFILYNRQHSQKMRKLDGGQFYRYIIEYTSAERFQEVLSSSYKHKYDLFTIRDSKEALMVKDGYTYFKGMKVEDVSVLSFDLEHSLGVGDQLDKKGELYLISNTFRRKGKITRKLFARDEYSSQGEMLMAWVNWVREMDPSVILAHNQFGHDLRVLKFVSDLTGVSLDLGRDRSVLRFASRTSQFRKDGSQSYEYTNAFIYGREIVDSWFLAMKYDVAARREYESYGLKAIIEHEGLERKNRQHYDASKIKENWHNPEERKKIKAYAIDDADDALKLYDLMVPSLFYYAQSIPRSFQAIVNSATGSQINSLMVRAYLQQGHSIARGSEKEEYKGAISFGVPGIHKNVFKIDVQSLYPSIIISEKLCNREKDPQELFLKIIEFFTEERIKNKELWEKTNDRYYRDLSDSQKIVINSMYGFLGAPKLNYNSPAHADRVTEVGRNILMTAIKWASGQDYVPTLGDDGDSEDVA